MAHDRQAKPDIHRTEQGVLNRSFDEKYEVLAVELLAENADGTAVNRLKATESGELEVALPTNAATEQTQLDNQTILNEIATFTAALAAAKGVAADIRVTLVGGSASIGTVTTVTTVSTLSNTTSIGGLSAVPMLQNTQNQAAVQSNINNIVRT